MNSDGTGVRQLTKGSWTDTMADWSPTGEWIAFASDRGGDFEVWLVHPDGTGLRKLTGKGGYEPAWAPDGRRVLFHRRSGADRRIMSVDLNASNLQTMTSGVEGRRVNVFSVDQQPVR
jgi:TolB protein